MNILNIMWYLISFLLLSFFFGLLHSSCLTCSLKTKFRRCRLFVCCYVLSKSLHCLLVSIFISLPVFSLSICISLYFLFLSLLFLSLHPSSFLSPSFSHSCIILAIHLYHSLSVLLQSHPTSSQSTPHPIAITITTISKINTFIIIVVQFHLKGLLIYAYLQEILLYQMPTALTCLTKSFANTSLHSFTPCSIRSPFSFRNPFMQQNKPTYYCLALLGLGLHFHFQQSLPLHLHLQHTLPLFRPSKPYHTYCPSFGNNSSNLIVSQ